MKFNILIGPLLLFLLWVILSQIGFVSIIILPTPSSVGEALLKLLFVEGNLWLHIGLSLYRTLLSFFLACFIGIPIGLLMGFFPPFYKTCEFLVDFFRSIPPIALFPLFLLTLGIGEYSKLGVPFYGCMLIIIVNSAYGVVNVPPLRRMVGQVYGFSLWAILWKIVLPDSLPQVFVGMRIAISLALVLTIVVEMFIGSVDGLGKKIYDYHLVFDIPEMYATIIMTGMVGYLLNKGFVLVERKYIHWADK